MGTGDALVDVLLSPGGEALLARIVARTAAGTAPLPLQRALRRDHPAEVVRFALRIAEARRAATAKFPDAAYLLFTPELLEQATAHPVARHRALRFADCGRVLDLGCGAGGDLTRLAGAGVPATGLERDALAAALARANLRRLDLDGTVVDGEFPGADLPPHDALFVDPARRETGRGPAGSRRRHDPRRFSPAPRDLWPLLERTGAWAVKWGPGLDLDHAALTASGAILDGLPAAGYAVEVVGWQGTVREAVLWGGEDLLRGPAAPGAPRLATVLCGGLADARACTYAGDPVTDPPPLSAPATYLAEPDGTLLRAGLLDAFAREHGLASLAPGIAYLTAPAPVRSPWLRWWRRLESVPWSPERLQAALDRHDAGSVVIKKRGFPLTPEQVRAGLVLRGSREVTVLLHRADTEGAAHSGYAAHLAEPCDGEAG
ncbi:MAG: SAM-dependent methyltransferase [bacterium]|nr:SAM-dependent methyltransferase [bacterium]